MSASAAIAVDPAALPEDRARLERQLARLDRLAELGLEIAEGLAAQARGTGPQVVEGDLALAYDRVARAVRMAVLLQSRLAGEARQAGAASAGPAPDPAGARKDQISRIVKRVAEDDERLDGFQVSWCAREARERLEHDDIYGQVMSRPVSDVVAAICRDLGLTPDWARLAAEAWAQGEIDSGEAGRALQGLLRDGPGLGPGDDDDDDDDDDDGDGEGAAGPAARPAPSIPTFEDCLLALAEDPEIRAAAGRPSG